jgi:hypothetical protein
MKLLSTCRTSLSLGTGRQVAVAWKRTGRKVEGRAFKLDYPAVGAPPRSRSVRARDAGSICHVGPAALRTNRRGNA